MRGPRLVDCQPSLKGRSVLHPSASPYVNHLSAARPVSPFVLRAYLQNQTILLLTLFLASLAPFKFKSNACRPDRFSSLVQSPGSIQPSRVDISDKVEEILKGTRTKSTYSIQLVLLEVPEPEESDSKFISLRPMFPNLCNEV